MYYIYHIPGVKIGCTANPKLRIQYRQGFKNYEILETHTDVHIASERELELQKQYGYKRDNNLSYYQTLKICKKGAQNSKKVNCIPVLAYEYNTGKFVGEFESIIAASIELNIGNRGNIGKHLKGILKQVRGYTFQYKIVK
jgi:hypothetical protein